MNGPVKLDSPYPSVEETARLFGVPPSRVKEIVRLADSVNGVIAHKTRKKRAAPKRAFYKGAKS